MDQLTEKSELRELTDLEIENVSGGSLALAGVAWGLAWFAAGVAVGHAMGKR